MCIGFNIYCIETRWHSLQSITFFVQSYGSLLHLNPNFLRLASVKAEPPAKPWVCAPGQQQPAGLQSFVIVLEVNGFHASAANLWTVQQPGTKALNFKVYIAPCWDLCATVTSGLSVFPPPPECWWEADSAGVPGGLKGRPLYCSGAVTLWWTCVIVEGKWGFNGRSMHFFPHGRFSISGYAPALSEYQSYCNKKRERFGLKPNSEQTLSALSLYSWIIQYSPLVCWQSSNVAVMSEERGCPVLFLPNVMYWLLPIVADVLFSVLSTEKWACAGQSSRQQLCFPGFLRIPSTSSALLTLFCYRLFTGSRMDPALHPYLAPCHLYWEFWLIPGVDCKSFLLHGHLCRVAVCLHFPVRIGNQYSLWCDRGLKTHQQDFHSIVCASAAMWHRTHSWAPWTVCECFHESCAVIPPRWHSRGPNSLSCWLFGNSDSRNMTRSNSSAASSPPGKTYGKDRRQHVLQNKEQCTVYL